MFMKIAIITTPGYGPINNTLGLAKRLVQCGHTVVYFNAPEFSEIIKATGARFHNYLVKDAPITQEMPKKPEAILQMYNMQNALYQSRNLLFLQTIIVDNLYQLMQSEAFDLLMYDSSTLAGMILSQKLGIPAISLFSTALLNRSLVKEHPEILFESYFRFSEVKAYGDIAKGVNRIKKMFEYELRKIHPLDDYLDLYMCEGSINIVFSMKSMIPNSELFDDRFYFTGPIIEEFYKRDNSIKYKQKKSLIYVNFGTTEVLNQDLIFYIYRELQDMDVDVLFSLGCDRDIDSFGSPPKNFIVKNFVPQKKVLAEADAIICSGSVNTINEAICFGVPIVAIPFAQADHFIMANQIVSKGIGIHESIDNLKENRINQAITEVLSSERIKHNLMKLKEEYNKHNPLEEAMEHINHFMNKYKTT